MALASVEFEAVGVFGRRKAVDLVLGELDDVGAGRWRGGLGGVGEGGGGAGTGGIGGGMDAVSHGRRRERERERFVR